MEAAEKQCKELEKVVALIENNRQRFRHIDNVRACLRLCVRNWRLWGHLHRI